MAINKMEEFENLIMI
ncbi:Protein of unknown function [Lactobacillus helveticus CIRM-BIA 951]|uniref:Uncharacterized protein n=1 Tax=Lactobacillus helveticus CIRM-BIA 951 TaxID=1226334 RepID=U6F1I4_LACHE|nr:Protein of unknown function [Lactobacillus helveticus CIRM-BIA 951]